MAEYFSPIELPATDEALERSIEQLLGIPCARPSFSRPQQWSPPPELQILAEQDDENSEENVRMQVEVGLHGIEHVEFFQRFHMPMEERRKVPGCGIDHHDIFDEPVGYEIDTVLAGSEVFRRENVRHVFDRSDSEYTDPRSSAIMVGGNSFGKSQVECRQYRGPANRTRTIRRRSLTFPRPQPHPSQTLFSSEETHRKDHRRPQLLGQLSPLTSSSSSSSSSSSIDSPEFMPLATSSFHNEIPTPRRFSYSRVDLMPKGRYIPSHSPHSSPEPSIASSVSESPSPIAGWSNFPHPRWEQRSPPPVSDEEVEFSDSAHDWDFGFRPSRFNQHSPPPRTDAGLQLEQEGNLNSGEGDWDSDTTIEI